MSAPESETFGFVDPKGNGQFAGWLKSVGIEPDEWFAEVPLTPEQRTEMKLEAV